MPLNRDELLEEIAKGAKGYGIRTGTISGGILAIDADGSAAEELLQNITNGNLPETVAFTSGKSGRCQRLFSIPPQYWDKIKTLKLKSCADDGTEQLLEFRWNGCQSVLPPSAHPEMGKYFWIKSPQDIAVAPCPQDLIKFLINYQPPQRSIVFPSPTPQKSKLFSFLPTVTIHSSIADPGNWEGKNHKGQVAGHGCTKLWYFLRSLDYQGCGNVEIDLRIAAIALDKSLYTIRRWLKSGLELGFFRGCLRVGTKKYRIFYTSLRKICYRLNLVDIGACTDIEIENLGIAKFLATEAITKQQQERSKFLALEGKRKNLSKCIPPADQLTTSDLCTGAILLRAGRFTYLNHYAHPHGSSQKTIASKLGRHETTVQRRLSDGYRERHGLEAIPKTQLLAHPVRKVTRIDPANGEQKAIAIRTVDKAFSQKIWKTSLGYFRLCPNVYNISLELTPKRRLRSNVKRHNWKAGEREFDEWMRCQRVLC
jgi:hypothetical protein